MQISDGDNAILWLSNLLRTSVWKAQARQRISNKYIYLYVSDQSVYIGSESRYNKLEIQHKCFDF